MPQYFHFHTEDGHHFDTPLMSMQCQFIKEDESQCRKRCMIGLPMCWIHIRAAYHVKIDNSRIQGAGKGLFSFDKTKEDTDVVHKKGDIICPYFGQQVDKTTIDERYRDYTSPYGAQKHRGLYEDGGPWRGIGTLANHTAHSRANAKLSVSRTNQLQIMATKPIRNNTEILVSYGRQYRFTDPVTYSTNGSKTKV